MNADAGLTEHSGSPGWGINLNIYSRFGGCLVYEKSTTHVEALHLRAEVLLIWTMVRKHVLGTQVGLVEELLMLS